MAGFAQRNPARVVLPASAALLAGMAWRVGWIDGTVIGPVVACLLMLTVWFFAALFVTLPFLLAGGLLFRWAWRLLRRRWGCQPMPAVPTQPGMQVR